MPQPAKPQNSRPGSTPLSRRRLLAGAGGAVAAGALFSRAGFASAAGQRSAAGRWFATSAADKPTLSQWYHGYGEEGVEDAVRRFAADYPDANVEVQWFPADYDYHASPRRCSPTTAPTCSRSATAPTST